jgi:hypothetical protein
MPENNIWGGKIHLELDLFRDCAAFSESRFWCPDGDWGRSGRQPGAHLSLSYLHLHRNLWSCQARAIAQVA